MLVGSYARKVSIWPGKDVDVFGRLSSETVESIGPDDAYGLFASALEPFAAQGRLKLQPRSLKIEYGPNRVPNAAFVRDAAAEYGWDRRRVERVVKSLPEVTFAFSVDVVPAVRWDEHYGIPELGRNPESGERYRTGLWKLTAAMALTELTQLRNRSPTISGVGGFVRLVKEIKQIKTCYLPDAKPSSLYYEFVLHEGFDKGSIAGDSWADLSEAALSYIAQRLRSAESEPVRDPLLHEAYAPAPTPLELIAAAQVFEDQATGARRAVSENGLCRAAVQWRGVFGRNGRVDPVFPLPQGCRSDGTAMGAAVTNAATGGTAERSFGER